MCISICIAGFKVYLSIYMDKHRIIESKYIYKII
jgi:hypothetical protein